MKIIIAGDVAPITERIIEQIDNGMFDKMFPSDLVETVESADYSIVNLECPVAGEDVKGIQKNGPLLKCSSKTLEAIKYVGFQGVTLANNHILDYGRKGLVQTVSCCKKLKIDTVGGGGSLQEAAKILYIERNEEKLAIINCCEHEFSIASANTAGANPLNPISQYNVIKKAKKNADYVVVIVHGGHEHYQLPSPRMKVTYRFFIDAGADAVINHHQHCFSGYEFYKNKPIVYGLGNFAFDWEGKRNSIWNKGYLVKLELKAGVELELIPYEQYGDTASVMLMKSREAFDANILKLNEIIANDEELNRQFELFSESRIPVIQSIFEPSQNRWIRFAINRSFIPSMITQKWLIKMYNIIECEAHRDTLLYYLKKTIRK